MIGGDDCIIIRGVADARVTIVSMDGRSQQQMVNGDTRINVRAGVYGVILEQGTPDAIFSTPREERTKNFLASVL